MVDVGVGENDGIEPGGARTEVRLRSLAVRSRPALVEAAVEQEPSASDREEMP